jgi:electron transfer flavoprotein beta subunit
MNIFVCLKQTPARDSVICFADHGKWIDESGLTFELNEPDAFALEEGIRLREGNGGEVVVVSMGSERTIAVIREALAKGADRGILIESDESFRVDAFATAKALAAVLSKESPDIVLTGLQADDLGFGQTGVILAELLNLPHASIVVKIVEISDGSIQIKKELEAGWFQNIDMPLPALLTIQSGTNKPRYATLMGIKKARKKPVDHYSIRELGVESLMSQTIEHLYAPPKTKETQFFEGSSREVADKLAEKLKFEARIL